MTFIRRVPLNADTPLPPPPKVFNVPLTLRIEIEGDVPDCVTGESLREMLTQDTYRDGREDFGVELANHALGMSAEKAVRQVVERAMQDQYAREVVDHGNGSSSGRWYVEAEKVLEKLKVCRWATRLH